MVKLHRAGQISLAGNQPTQKKSGSSKTAAVAAPAAAAAAAAAALSASWNQESTHIPSHGVWVGAPSTRWEDGHVGALGHKLEGHYHRHVGSQPSRVLPIPVQPPLPVGACAGKAAVPAPVRPAGATSCRCRHACRRANICPLPRHACRRVIVCPRCILCCLLHCIRCGQAWAGMGRHGQAWAGMGRHGQAWAGMGRHGQAWAGAVAGMGKVSSRADLSFSLCCSEGPGWAT